MYWLSMPPLFGLTVPWWPCGPIPITPAPNSSIAWSITPPAPGGSPPGKGGAPPAPAAGRARDAAAPGGKGGGATSAGAPPPLARRLASRRHRGARAQPPSLAAPVLQQQVRADPVQPRER